MGGRGVWSVHRAKLDAYLEQLEKETAEWAKGHPLTPGSAASWSGAAGTSAGESAAAANTAGVSKVHQRVLAIILSVCLATTVALVATADEVTRRDDLRRDAGGPLDIKEVSHGHRGTRLVHTLRTYDPWRSRWLRGSRDVINLTFDRQDGGADSVERVLVVDWKDGRLRGEVVDVLTDPPAELGRVRIERPTRRLLRLIFAKRLLRGSEPLDAYRWRVNVSYEGPGCDDSFCFDLLPESGHRAILHELR